MQKIKKINDEEKNKIRMDKEAQVDQGDMPAL